LEIYCHGKKISLRTCGKYLLNPIRKCADLLDQAMGSSIYSASIFPQVEKIDDPQKTPSARMLETMAENNLSFYELALKQSQEHCRDFLLRPLDRERDYYFDNLRSESVREQLNIERNDHLTFKKYLENYFQQYLK